MWSSAALKQTVNKWRQSGAFCRNKNAAQDQQKDDNWCEPPLLPLDQEPPELSNDCELFHSAGTTSILAEVSIGIKKAFRIAFRNRAVRVFVGHAESNNSRQICQF